MNLPISKHVTPLLSLLASTVIIVVQLSFNNREMPETPKWHGNDHFKITHEDDLVSVRMSKMPWESFSVDIQPMESIDGFLSFEVRSEKPVTLRVDGLSTGNRQVELFKEEISGGNFQRVLYSLSSAGGKISHLIFYVNPGEVFNGEIHFKGLTMKHFDEEEGSLSVFPNPTAGDLLVRLPHRNFTHLVLYDEQGNAVLNKTLDEVRTVTINLNGRKAGLYVLKARSGNEMLITKVVLKH